MANSHTANGRAEEMSGRFREAYGTLTDDQEMEAHGARQRLKGRARRAYGEARHRVEDAADNMGRAVSDQPIPAVMIAAALGFVLGMIAFSGEDRDSRWSARRRAM